MRHNRDMEPGEPIDDHPAGDAQLAGPSREMSVAAGLEALLDFYVSAGADAWLESGPVDAFALTARPPVARHPQSGQDQSAQDHGTQNRAARHDAVPASLRAAQTGPGGGPAQEHARPVAQPPAALTTASGAVLPGDEAVVAARAAARTAATLEELRETLARFEGCNLRLTAKSLVFADGPANAPLMFVGEAPGRDEDLRGMPFVGRSGQLLDRMIEAIGLTRGDVYITNVVPWRPPGNRTPSPQETEICKPFVLRQIELVRPRVLVFLGGASAKALTGAQEGILRLRGRWTQMPLGDDGAIKAVATLHPAYLLRNPVQKRLAWRDFLAVREALGSPQAG